MTQHVTPEQLEIFNRYFNIQQFKQNVEYRTHEKITNQNLSEYLLGNKEFFEQPINHLKNEKTIFYITNKLHPFGNLAKPISYIQDIKDFILNEMKDILCQKSNPSREQDFQKKLELFNQNFTLDLVQTKEYYHDSVELTFKDLESSIPIRDTIDFDEPEDAHLEILESYHAINRGSELIRTVKTMGQVKYFIENGMYDYL